MASLSGLGRLLFVLGLALAVAGAVLVLVGRLGMPRLPGDIVVERRGFTLYAPMATSLLVSLVLSLILNLLLRR
jgi:hypothetical protein